MADNNEKVICDIRTMKERLNAAENGMAKLSALVEDLINGNPELQKQKSIAARAAAIASIAAEAMLPKKTDTPIEEIDPALAYNPLSVPTTMIKFASYADSERGFANMEEVEGAYPMAAIVQNVKDLRTDLDHLFVTFLRTMEDSRIVPADLCLPPSQALATAMLQARNKLEHDAAVEAAAFTGIPLPPPEPGALDHGPPTRKGGFKGSGGVGTVPFDPTDLYLRIFALDKRIINCCDNIDRTNDSLNSKMQRVEDSVDHILEQMGINTNDIKITREKTDSVKDLEGMLNLFETVQGMQEQLKLVHDTATQIAAEKEQRQHHINTLLEQIELLKVTKLDREDMLEAMAEKADVKMLARKVNHDQFEMACDDLAKGLEKAIAKLNLQEALWQQALDDIQRDIDTKLNKLELTPVKDYFNKKIKILQDNLEQLAKLKRQIEAAGTKKKLLKDVNCITCDTMTVMAMEADASLISSKPATAIQSMGPHLAFELDAIRKTQAANVGHRTATHDAEPSDMQRPVKLKSETNKHLCNRYCGGSHTMTTPAQRVARTGHFIKQWGPDVLPLSSGLATGDDGKMYKVTTVEAANVGPGGSIDPTCTPKKKVSDTKIPPPRQLVISNNARLYDPRPVQRKANNNWIGFVQKMLTFSTLNFIYVYYRM